MAKFKFKYGVMNSGKSQELLRIWYSYTDGNILDKSALVMTPKRDDRYGHGRVTSRAGQQIPAHVISQETPVRYYLDHFDDFSETECILVDEVQFLSQQDIYDLKTFVLERNIPVIAFGLLKDFQNNLFEGSQACIVVAEEIAEVETICSKCRKKAIMNVRLDANGDKLEHGEQIEIGGNETYVSVCHDHWLNS